MSMSHLLKIQKKLKIIKNYSDFIKEEYRICIENLPLDLNKLLLLILLIRHFELSQRYVGAGLSYSVTLVDRPVKEYGEVLICFLSEEASLKKINYLFKKTCPNSGKKIRKR
ncbi:hypothetical protein BpHYR1_006318 [Brachionus plicatilis]|uniref:Uncharacterized protein n=1 Tax=Brachionus plicatilis TaxID=10195 RepID=A0A3M7PPI8_BRAPC|nr:hypothetical protein BpHYR1_006318 [Brachionus plicatilis]